MCCVTTASKDRITRAMMFISTIHKYEAAGKIKRRFNFICISFHVLCFTFYVFVFHWYSYAPFHFHFHFDFNLIYY